METSASATTNQAWKSPPISGKESREALINGSFRPEHGGELESVHYITA
jgi:hypothetical protein